MLPPHSPHLNNSVDCVSVSAWNLAGNLLSVVFLLSVVERTEQSVGRYGVFLLCLCYVERYWVETEGYICILLSRSLRLEYMSDSWLESVL